MPNWWGKDSAEEEADKIKKAAESAEFKAPKDVTDKLAKIDGIETSMAEFKEKTKVLDRMSTFLDEQATAKEAARKKEAEERAKKAVEVDEDEYITDPKAAIDKAMLPLKMAQINSSSLVMRREIFDDGTEFEFYTGEFKKKVDAYIDQLSPAAKVDPASIKNCYHLVLGQSRSEINAGKIKSRFSAVSTTNAKTSEGKDGDTTVTLSDEQKLAAKRFGIKEDEYAKSFKELNYV